MTDYVNEIVDRIRKFFMYKNRVPNPIQFTTIDHKYYIRNKLGKNVVWIVVEYGNPVETTTNTFTGSLEDCKSYLRTIGCPVSRFRTGSVSLDRTTQIEQYFG